MHDTTGGIKLKFNIQVDPFGQSLIDEQGFPLGENDPRKILVEQMLEKLYEGCESLFYSVTSAVDPLNCLLQVQLYDKLGGVLEATMCKVGTAKRIEVENQTFDKLEAFCPENVPHRVFEKPVYLDSMGGMVLKLTSR
tara:strand:- start:212 stop:625 length:414 start_codon:yes stop_codon:yes gene_type:complete